jgi:hypothetical protein
MFSLHESRFSTFWSLNSLNTASNGAPIDCTTSIHSTQPFVNVPHNFFLHHYEFNYSSLFVTCVRHRRHFHRLRQRCYLSDDRVLKLMCAINIDVATSQFSHCYLYSGMRKKCGALFSEQLPYIRILLSQVYCVWQVVKIPTNISNNPVYPHITS